MNRFWIPALTALAAVATAGPAFAAGKEAPHYLGADLGKIALSPAPLGPPATFVKLKSQARGGDVARLRAPGRVEARQAPVRPVRVVRKRGNPLDAQARDTRIQSWPCRSGGICDWKQ